MEYRVEYYADENLRVPTLVERVADERTARRRAARLLGHCSLRGAASWARYQGGVVYQFGPRDSDNGYPLVVIVSDEEADRAMDEYADYDVER